MNKREVIELDSSSDEDIDCHVTKKREIGNVNTTSTEKATKTPAEIRRELMLNAMNKRVSNPNLLQEEVDRASTNATTKTAPVDTQLRSRIRLFCNPDYCSNYNIHDGDKDTVSMNDLLGSTQLKHSYQFNFMIDMAFVTKFAKSTNVKFTLINQSQSEFLHIPDNLWEKYQIHSIDASKNLKKYGSHHTKMMINFFNDETCQIVIHSMNLTHADYLLQTQMAWVSPRLKFDNTKSNDIKNGSLKIDQTGLLFKRDLFRYLGRYEEPEINELMESLRSYNFDPIDVVFIGSAPGEYKYHDKEKLKDVNSPPCFGYGRLWQIIQQHKLQSLDGSFIAQMSSISGPFDGFKRNIFVHVLTSCVESGYPFAKNSNYEFERGKRKVEPMIIWPTVKEILSNFGGAQSGRALFYTTNGKWQGYKRQAEVLKNYLYKWRCSSSSNKSEQSKREYLSPHVKTYTLTEDRFKTLKWFILTSANVSSHAWGKPMKFDPANKTLLHYEIGSYEVGVFVVPERLHLASDNGHEQLKRVQLIPTYGRDTLPNGTATASDTIQFPIRLPYDTPLEKYGVGDEPWARPDVEVHMT